jgi:acyl dehydratase
MKVGDEKVLVKPPVERIQLVKYAGASGDFNRIHVEEEYARAAGYKSVFAHGMLVMGFLGQLVSDWVGPARVAKVNCRFKAITWPGDVITCRGKVISVGETAEVALTATTQEGATVAEGSAILRV